MDHAEAHKVVGRWAMNCDAPGADAVVSHFADDVSPSVEGALAAASQLQRGAG